MGGGVGGWVGGGGVGWGGVGGVREPRSTLHVMVVSGAVSGAVVVVVASELLVRLGMLRLLHSTMGCGREWAGTHRHL